jgi:hypothetical protein
LIATSPPSCIATIVDMTRKLSAVADVAECDTLRYLLEMARLKAAMIAEYGPSGRLGAFAT